MVGSISFGILQAIVTLRKFSSSPAYAPIKYDPSYYAVLSRSIRFLLTNKANTREKRREGEIPEFQENILPD